MKSIIFFLFMLCIAYGNEKIDVDAKYIPKILSQVFNIKDKFYHNTVRVAIIYNNSYRQDAIRLSKNLSASLYKRNKKVEIDTININNYSSLDNYTFVYLFDIQNIEHIYKDAKNNRILSFCYNLSQLQNGCAMHITSNNINKIVYNKNIINDSNIIFTTSFLKVIKSYE